ncbi:hypothetical protein TRIUR3_27069 [Triticum urartu]|uniref:Uncharacterized protein n=1 Tax=Triticum urartu TaxID=4572 RepID=M8A445_TRIUA|nr:hypothetical protein TRIUR3_27069 [Triticum urartu]
MVRVEHERRGFRSFARACGRDDAAGEDASDEEGSGWGCLRGKERSGCGLLAGNDWRRKSPAQVGRQRLQGAGGGHGTREGTGRRREEAAEGGRCSRSSSPRALGDRGVSLLSLPLWVTVQGIGREEGAGGRKNRRSSVSPGGARRKRRGKRGSARECGLGLGGGVGLGRPAQ